MSMTFDELKSLLQEENLRFFVHPSDTAALLGFTGMFGSYQVVIRLDMEGRFLQFRTVGYLHCKTDHPHLTEVLKILGQTNFRVRLVKFGWDPDDGEIMAYADMWLMDGRLTREQFQRMLQNLLPTIDLASVRIKKTMETGKDPGKAGPEAAPPDVDRI